MQIEGFIEHGFVHVDEAFPRAVAEECCDILWRDTGCVRDDPTTWTEPVIRLPSYAHEPFVKAANTPRLHAAFDQLVGRGMWKPRTSLGTVPVRFPHPGDPGDDGWHIEASYSRNGKSCTNVYSRERALLMLFLFSDVSENDAPTRIRVGSHLAVPPYLAAAGEAGMTSDAIGATGLFEDTACFPQALATGRAGDVFLCHPFLVHAAQRHRDTKPRFMAQPPLYPAKPYWLARDDGAYSPVELAILRGLRRVE